MSTFQDEDASLLNFGPEFEKATCLMNSDVLKILQEKKELQPDPEYMPNPVFEKSFAYVSKFRKTDNSETSEQLRKVLIEKYKLHQFEACSIGNLNPNGVQEVKSLIPSLVVARGDPISDEQIQAMLNEIYVNRRFS